MVQSLPYLVNIAAGIGQSLWRGMVKCLAICSMENAAPLASDPSLLEVYHRLGLRMLGITHVRRRPPALSSEAI